ncbi:MAG: 4-hydroxybenzoyl-CoA thioesterase family active site, partial [uncultured Gemmatimonadetes bacterium]
AAQPAVVHRGVPRTVLRDGPDGDHLPSQLSHLVRDGADGTDPAAVEAVLAGGARRRAAGRHRRHAALPRVRPVRGPGPGDHHAGAGPLPRGVVHLPGGAGGGRRHHHAPVHRAHGADGHRPRRRAAQAAGRPARRLSTRRGPGARM